MAYTPDQFVSPSNCRPVIAHVLHRMAFAGAEVLAAALARQLSDQYQFLFFCLDGIGTLGKQLQEENLLVIDLQRKPGWDFSVAKRIGQLCQQHRVQLLHAHQYTPFFYAALSRKFSSQPPILFTEHGRHYPDQRKTKRVLANKLLLRPQDQVVAVGDFIKQALVKNEGIQAKKINVIYNGIEAKCFDPNQYDRQAIRQQLGLQNDTLVILQVARFAPVKDHATAIDAFAQVLAQWPDAKLLLAGDGPLQTQAQQQAQSLGIGHAIDFLGVRQDIAQLMAAADLFLLSSLSEGISVTLLEAMAARLPIVATDVGGNAEVVVHNQTGLLTPRQDAQGISQNILTLFKDPARCLAMGQAGYQRQQQLFTQKQMHGQYALLYPQPLAKGGTLE